MQNTPGSVSNWDGQLPPHIARNEQIWWGWEAFPRIRPRLPSKLIRLLGGLKQSPPPETISKVVLVADTKGDLGTAMGSLLNDWGCYCQVKRETEECTYMAGTATKPSFMFEINWQTAGLLSMATLAFIATIGSEIDAAAGRKILEGFEKELLGCPKEIEVPVIQFDPGPWENGLDIAFKACIWICSNREEALKSIWGIQD